MPFDSDSTRLGTGNLSAVTLGSIGLSIPYSPTGVLDGEPAIFVPPRWTARVVSLGASRLPTPLALPSAEWPVAGKRTAGTLIHLAPNSRVVLGRSPQAREESESEDTQVGIEFLKVGSEAQKISSAVVSFVRVRKDDKEGVFAVNGHYRRAKDRNPPKLFPFVGGGTAAVQQLNGPGTSRELRPGMEVWFGYLLEGATEPRTYNDPQERLAYTTGLVDLDPALSLADLAATAKLGDRTTCLALKKEVLARVQLIADEGEAHVLCKEEVGGVPTLRLDLRVAARRITRQRLASILIGSNMGALQAVAATSGLITDLVVVPDPALAPAHARITVRPDGELLLAPLEGASVQSTDARGVAHEIVREEFILDATVLRLGDGLTTKVFNRKTMAAPPPPVAKPGPERMSATMTGTVIGRGVRAAASPPASGSSGLLGRLLGWFRRG